MAQDAGVALKALSEGLAGLAERAGARVVSVEGGGARASGFLWRPGLVVTADEALGEGENWMVTLPGGAETTAQLRGRDPSTDVALLKLDGGGPEVEPLASAPARPGALALALGREPGRNGGDLVAAFGAVTRAGGAWRSMRGGAIDARVELGLRLSRAAEGGLALAIDGAALGLAVYGPRRRVLVIPMATVDRVAGRLAEHGRIARGWLGVGLQPVAVEGHEGMGVMVMNLEPAGPAAAAGVLQGDVVLSLGGLPVRRVQDIAAALGPESIGQALELGVRRAGAATRVTVTVAERPEA